MITLLALVAGSAAPALMDTLNPVDPVNPLDIIIPDIDAGKAGSAICPLPTPLLSHFTRLAEINKPAPVDNRELSEYQIEPVDENEIINQIPAIEIDPAQDAHSIGSGTTDNMVIQGSPVTGSDMGLPPGSYDQQSPVELPPNPDYWPEGLLNRDNSIHYGDFRNWLKDINNIYDEEPLFRSILKLPFPSAQSQLFPDTISPKPTYGWILDNCLTDWINNRVMDVITPDPANSMDTGDVNGFDESAQHEASPETFDQIYIPFIETLEFQDDERTREFFQKLYELLAPLRGLLVIAIAGIDQPHGNSTISKGQRLSGLLNRSGFPAANIGVVSSHHQSYLLARRGQDTSTAHPP